MDRIVWHSTGFLENQPWLGRAKKMIDFGSYLGNRERSPWRLGVRDQCGVCCQRMTQCGTWSLAREILAEVIASSPTSVNVDTFTFSKCLSPVHFGFWIDAKRNL